MKIKSMATMRRALSKTRHLSRASMLFVSLLLYLLATVVPSAHAITTISQGYITNDKLSLGSIVSLEENSTDRVVGATVTTANSIIGVVINDGSSLLSLSTGQDNQVMVATNGVVQVLVSNINGDISEGDQITSSPIKGVGMKATANTKVVGIAQGKPSENGSSEQTYKDKNGQEKKVKLGQVAVVANVSYYFKQPEKTIIPSAIQNVANAVAGKTVSTLPILISAAIFLITLIVVVSIIYSMIRSSIISVGRNPMSQSAIYRDVIQLSALVLVIMAVSFMSIYMILRRF